MSHQHNARREQAIREGETKLTPGCSRCPATARGAGPNGVSPYGAGTDVCAPCLSRASTLPREDAHKPSSFRLVPALTTSGFGTNDNDAPKADPWRLLALQITEPMRTGALYANPARMADTRDDKPEALRRYERTLAAFRTMKEPPEGAVPVVEGRIRELGRK